MSVLSKVAEDPLSLVYATTASSVIATAGYLMYTRFIASKTQQNDQQQTTTTTQQQIKSEPERAQTLHELVAYIGTTFSLSSSLLSSILLINPEFALSEDGKAQIPIYYSSLPLVTSKIFERAYAKKVSLQHQHGIGVKRNWKYIGAGALAAPLLLGGSMLFDWMCPDVTWRTEKINYGILAGLFPILFIASFSGTFASEIPFQDFVAPRLSRLGFGFWKKSWITGALYGALQAPLVWTYGLPKYPSSEHFWMDSLTHTTAYTLLFPIYLYLNDGANSVLPTALFNGILYGLYPLTTLVANGTDYVNEFFGLTGILSLALGNLVLYFVKKRQSQGSKSQSVNHTESDDQEHNKQQ